MPKVLIISSPFFGYQRSVGDAFSRLGYEVHIETYDEPIHPFKGLLRWRHKFALNKEALREKSRQKYKGYIEHVFDEYQPDIVFTYNGQILKDDTLDYFRSHRATVIVWLYDSILRGQWNPCRSHIDHADLCCCYEKKDVDYYASIGKKAYFLPSAYDTSIYFPQQVNKDIDILFCGNIYTNPKRIQYLEHLVEHYPDKKILIYGEYKPYFKNPITWLFRKHRDIFMNCNIPPSEVNNLLARSKVALNIHHSQQVYGANPRLFEVCGAETYQVCDTNPYIVSLFPHGEVGLYQTEDEMFSLIDYALTHDMSSQARQAHEIVMHSHTFDQRVKQMLNLLQL